MKPLLAFSVLFISISSLMAGESGLTKTYQPLDALGADGIRIVEVTCHDWYGTSIYPTAIGLISARNVPPTNNPKEAKEDLNIASVCGLRFSCGDTDEAKDLTLDATAFVITERFGHPKEHILRASLECLRRCLPKTWLKAPLILKASKKDAAWMGQIVQEFNKHDRKKVFFAPPQ